jgi:hypothetical protein
MTALLATYWPHLVTLGVGLSAGWMGHKRFAKPADDIAQAVKDFKG